MSAATLGAAASGAPVPGGGGGLQSELRPQTPRVEKYELLEEIGHGGMATVYRARDPRLGREVAVKVIHRHLRENAEVGTRFVAEARAAAKLRHPGIVDVFDVSNEDDPERYLVVELVRGTTLRKVLQQHRDMPAEVGAAIVLQLCEAVEHAHALSIIHRDIKPENVLVELPRDRALHDGLCHDAPDPDGTSSAARPRPHAAGEPSNDLEHATSEGSDLVSDAPGDTQTSARDVVTPRAQHGHGNRAHRDRPAPKARVVDPGVVIKITDFGIAKILDAQGVTSTGQVLGSPAHMAPEQIEGGEVDPRTDVFALGVLMYECLVGHLPFEGKNPAQVLRRVLEGIYPAADRERPSVGGRWARILASALARDPADRIASAGQLGEQIRVELEALGVPDARAEISAYFADPPAYAEAHTRLLVPRLTARGEAARKARDVRGAAADWNRALALAPDDLTILKRMASLTSSAGRRQLLRRAGAIAAGSVALGLGAFGVARTLKARGHDASPPSATAQGSAALPPGVEGTASAVPELPTRHVPLASAPAPADLTARVPRIAATPSYTPTPPNAGPASGVRDVQIVITPKGAVLSIDGVARPDWFRQVFQLSVGSHALEATPIDAHCCKKAATVVEIKPLLPGQPGEPQKVYVNMDLQPATVSLTANAPPRADMSCPEIGLDVTAGSVAQAKLRMLELTVSCMFTAPGRPLRQVNVSFKAGEAKAVPWPE